MAAMMAEETWDFLTVATLDRAPGDGAGRRAAAREAGVVPTSL